MMAIPLEMNSKGLVLSFKKNKIKLWSAVFLTYKTWDSSSRSRATTAPTIRDFLSLLLLPLAGGPKDGKRLMPIEGLFLLPASIQAQIIVKGIRRNETAAIKTVRKKPLRHWCDWGDLVEGSFVKQNVLQRRVSKLLNESPYGRQNQTNRRYMFRKTSSIKS